MLGAFLEQEDGQSMVEYGLILSLVILAAMAGFSAYSSEARKMLERTCNTVGQALPH